MLFGIGGSETALSLISALSPIGLASTPASGNAASSVNGGQTFALGNNSGPSATTVSPTSGSGASLSAMTPETMSTLFSVQGATSSDTTATSASDDVQGWSQGNGSATASPSETVTGGESTSGSDDPVAPSTQTFANANGSLTTTTTLADGTQITAAAPAANPSESGGAVGYLLGQLMREAQALGSVAGPSMSVSV